MPESTPLVSIGVPTFNRPTGLRRTIECMLAQDHTNIEIIVSDNCSDKPEVELMCLDLASKDSRIKYHRQNSNIGMYKNFEFVVQNANGKYFAWACDDDEWAIDFISKCIEPLERNENIVLCAATCKVLFDVEKEVMKFKPDFDTIGLNKMDRIRKIAFYIKKSHGALSGLYRTEIIKKINIQPYLDCDGLILLQTSQYGAFYKLDEFLVTTHISTINKEAESLTYQKEKMITTYKMRPKYFLMNYERMTVFIYFILQSLRWRPLGIWGHFKIIPILFRSFYGYNNIKVFSFIRNIRFYLKKKKIIVIHCIQANDDINLDELNKLRAMYGNLILSISSHKWNTYEPINPEEYNTKIESIKNESNVFVYEARWNNEHEQFQYGLDLIKLKFSNYTHCLLIKGDSSFASLEPSILYEKINVYKHFNRALKMNITDTSIIFPIRKFVRFRSESRLTVGEIILNNNSDN